MTCRGDTSATRGVGAAGFTVVELMVVVAVVGVMVGMLLAVVGKARAAARQVGCGSNIRQMGRAMQMYANDHSDSLFPLKQVLPGQGTLWWFGFEADGGPTAEGQRILDRTRGRLWPYYGMADSIEVCPSFPTSSPNYKPKYTTSWTTYGPAAKLTNPSGPAKVDQVREPSRTLAFADSAQLNTFQAPASPAHPMFEQWYYVSKTEETVFYNHNLTASAVMFDGHVQQIAPEFGVSPTLPEAPVGRPPSNVVLQLK